MSTWPITINHRFDEHNSQHVISAGNLVVRSYSPIKPKTTKTKLIATFTDSIVTTPDWWDGYGLGKEKLSLPKRRNKWFSDNVGGGFFRAWNAIQWKYWIASDFNVMSRLCRGMHGGFKPQYVSAFWQCREHLLQAMKDKNENLLPLIMFLKKPPEDLKEHFGKGLWKSLCKNSFSRNYKLGRAMFLHDFSFGKNALKCIPSSLIDKSAGIYDELIPVYNHLRETKELTSVSTFSLSRMGNIVRDTHRMSMDVGAVFNKKWDYATIKKKHDEFSRIIEERKFSPEKWDSGDWPQSITNGGYCAEILDSALALKLEGRAMHHCVGSYVEQCRKKSVVIYSFKEAKSNEKVSTCMLDFETGKIIQHYAACNSQIPKEHIEGVETLLSKIKEAIGVPNCLRY